jgi:hypothetical protein
MVVNVESDPKLEAVLKEHARFHGTTPEEAAVKILKGCLLPFQPQNDREVHLLARGIATRFAPTDSAFEREENYT